MRTKIIYGSLICGALLTGIVGTILTCHFFPFKTDIVEKTVKEVKVTEADSIASGIDNIYDAVVVVETYKGNRLYSSGTGFIYKKENNKGYIITNNHVIESGDKIVITTSKGKEAIATVLGTDEYADIAVISVDSSVVTSVAKIGKSANSKIGDTIFTVGTPVGKEYNGTVTKGILSNKDRKVSVSLKAGDFMLNVLQIDAAINPGNSGGPLCNINGEVIGVNSLKLVKDEIEGMGFAITIEDVMETVKNLETGKEVSRPMLGVSLIDVSNTYGLYLNDITIDESIVNAGKGVVILEVTKDSPASRAKLKKGDVILQINDDKITDSSQFKYLLYKYKINDTVTVKYYRDGKIENVKVKLNKALER